MSLGVLLFSFCWLEQALASNVTAFNNPIAQQGNLFFTFQGQPQTKPEPLNVIISAKSSFGNIGGANNSAIFLAQNGFSQYLTALNFSDECLGLHLSTPAYANVSSNKPQVLDFLYRENFGDLQEGTCQESLNGGYHFRGWRQSTSGAWFLAASKELNLTLKHDLVPNGYDIGRDEVVRRALIGGTDALGCLWGPAKLHNLTNLVQSDAGGLNGTYNHNIGIDGVVSLLTIGTPLCPIDSATSSTTNGSSNTPRSRTSSIGTKTSSAGTGSSTSASGGNSPTPSSGTPADTKLNSGSAALRVVSSMLASLVVIATVILC